MLTRTLPKNASPSRGAGSGREATDGSFSKPPAHEAEGPVVLRLADDDLPLASRPNLSIQSIEALSGEDIPVRDASDRVVQQEDKLP